MFHFRILEVSKSREVLQWCSSAVEIVVLEEENLKSSQERLEVKPEKVGANLDGDVQLTVDNKGVTIGRDQGKTVEHQLKEDMDSKSSLLQLSFVSECSSSYCVNVNTSKFGEVVKGNLMLGVVDEDEEGVASTAGLNGEGGKFIFRKLDDDVASEGLKVQASDTVEVSEDHPVSKDIADVVEDEESVTDAPTFYPSTPTVLSSTPSILPATAVPDPSCHDIPGVESNDQNMDHVPSEVDDALEEKKEWVKLTLQGVCTCSEREGRDNISTCSSSDEFIDRFDTSENVDCDENEALDPRKTRKYKRKQSPSPNRSDKRASIPRTPRKDTPKKIYTRIPCRNEGCKVMFGTIKARNRHERSNCSCIEVNLPETSGKTFEVPPHDKLGLDPLECRFPGCGSKKFKYIYNRERHERDKHRYLKQKERTLSPHPFPSFKEPELLNNSSFRPQSCPPTIQLETPGSERSFLAPAFHSTPHHSPVRGVSSSRLEASLRSSQGGLSGFLPARRLFPGGQSQKNEAIKKCQFCYFEFKNDRTLRKHNCNFNPENLVSGGVNTVVLTRPESWEESFTILNQLCIEDFVKLCKLNLWAIPSVYPLTFPGKYRAGSHGGIPPVLTEMSSFVKDDDKNFKHSLGILRKLVALHGIVKLPRCVLVVNSSLDLTSYIPSSMLIPPDDEFSVELTEKHFVVSRKVKDKAVTKEVTNEEQDYPTNSSVSRSQDLAWPDSSAHDIEPADHDQATDTTNNQCGMDDLRVDLDNIHRRVYEGEDPAREGQGRSREDGGSGHQDGVGGEQDEDPTRSGDDEVQGGSRDGVGRASLGGHQGGVRGEQDEDSVRPDDDDGQSGNERVDRGGDGGGGVMDHGENQGSSDDEDISGRGIGNGGGAGSGGGGGDDGGDSGEGDDSDYEYDLSTDEDEENEDLNIGVNGGGGGGGGGGSGGGGGGGGGDGGDSDYDEYDLSTDEDEDNEDLNNNLPQEILDLLPDNFDFGIDGWGSANNPQKQAANLFRNPLRFNNADFESLIKMTKKQFLAFVPKCVGAKKRKCSLSIFAQTFLLLFKLTHDVSYKAISTVFSLVGSDVARSLFWDFLVHQFTTNCNIPAIISNGQVNQDEVNKFLLGIDQRTPLYYKELMKDFEDPRHLGRSPVLINIDATYFDVTNSSDIELQKHLFYKCRSGHTVKLLNFTDVLPKFVAVLPIASSQSPSSGDGFLLSTHIAIEDEQPEEKYVRTVLHGNDQFFVILAGDAGFVTRPPNAPLEFSQNPYVHTLTQICDEEGAVLLHTSSKSERYHLQRTNTGKIVKVDWQEGYPTLDENVVKLTRMIRKTQEQIHGGLKQMFPMLNVRKLYLDSLKPLPRSQLDKFHLVGDHYRNLPRLNFYSTVCCSIFNEIHPGYKPAYIGEADQARIPRILLGRLFMENPLQYDIWPMTLTAAATTRSVWTEITFGDLESCNNLGFPQLTRESMNPVVFEISSGPHAILKGNSVLTYMRQLQIKGQNLTREQAIQQLRIFPLTWKIQFCDIKTPPDFLPTPETPFWSPDWWNAELFGPWLDLRLVRCKIPPSYRSATPSNHHWAMIGFSSEPTNRLGVGPPYDRILFWRCFKCPALNGFMSMDRHLSALLQGLSFRWFYQPTSRTPNLLNTVADRNRQTTVVLPPTMVSVDIPANTVRKSRNTRLMRGGQLNPLYDTSSTTGTSGGGQGHRGESGGDGHRGTGGGMDGQRDCEGDVLDNGGGGDGMGVGQVPQGQDREVPVSSGNTGAGLGSDGQVPLGQDGVGSGEGDDEQVPQGRGLGEVPVGNENTGRGGGDDEQVPHGHSSEEVPVGFGDNEGGGGSSERQVPQEQVCRGGGGSDDWQVPQGHDRGEAPVSSGNTGGGTGSDGQVPLGHHCAGDVPVGSGDTVTGGVGSAAGGSMGRRAEPRNCPRRGTQQQARPSRNSPPSPISRLNKYLHGLDRHNLHSIPAISSFVRQENFNVNELQMPGLDNCGNVCSIISIILCFHHLRLGDQLIDPQLCISSRTKPTLVLHKILRALPSQDSFSIFQFVLSWNKERIGQEIVQTSFAGVFELLDEFLSCLAIKSFRITPVFTKYVLSYRCQSCGNSDDGLEQWSEQFSKLVPILTIDSNQTEEIGLHQLSRYLSKPVQIRCPSVMCRSTIKDAVLKAVPGMFSAIAINRLSFDREVGLRKNYKKVDIMPQGQGTLVG